MLDILFWCVLLVAIAGIVCDWSSTFKVSYYETLLERYEKEGGIKLPDNYKVVKNDFWSFLK